MVNTVLRICLVLSCFGPLAAIAAEGDGPVAQILAALERGDEAAARAVASGSAAALPAALNGALEETDRDFDEMSRQKAVSETLVKQFERFMGKLAQYDRVFEISEQVTGDPGPLKRLRARRLRFEGAQQTTLGDLLWDDLQYDRANEAYSTAIQRLQDATAMARAIEDQKLVASCLNNMGYAAVSQGDAAEGLRRYREALEIAERRQDDVFKGMYNLNLGTYYLYTGDPQTSLRYSLEATELNRRTGRRTWEANTLLNVGSAHLQLQHTDEAERTLQQALAASTTANDRRSRGRILFNLALASSQARRDSEAAQRMTDALEWYRTNDDIYSRAERTVLRYQGLTFLAGAYGRLGMSDKANSTREELAAWRAQQGDRLTAYLADPHQSFALWESFNARK